MAFLDFVKAKKSACLAVALLFVLNTARAAETDTESETIGNTETQAVAKQPIKSFLSFDLGWFLHGLVNNGLAVGVNYERLVVNHFSLRGMAGAMFFNIADADANCLGVTTSIFANWYPMSKTLDKFYASLGLTADFLNYFGEGELPSPPRDALVSIVPLIGWKQNIANVIVLDFFGGYSFLVFSTQHSTSAGDYIRNGFQFGIRFKILWRPGRGKEVAPR